MTSRILHLASRHLQRFTLSRCLSSTTKPTDNKAFTETLLLPKTSFALRPNPKQIDNLYRKLTCDDLYRWQWDNATGPVFVLHDGPPYANGDLHMGHALNKVIKDIINRFHVLQGRKVHYVPGWDCHGLPIENKALKEMALDPLVTPASEIRRAAKATALREIESQREQFRLLGIMADWDSKERTYRTFDRHYVIRQLRIFQKMVEKGLIYRQHKPVYYSPSSRSALAEAELEYMERQSHAVYVLFDIDKNSIIENKFLRDIVSTHEKVQLAVWTTTPWTLSANMGIAVNNDLLYDISRCKNVISDGGTLIFANSRLVPTSDILKPVYRYGQIKGSDLVGLSYKPLFSFQCPSANSMKIIPSLHVTGLSGTGLVHCAPAHGEEDYNAFRSLGLLSKSNTILCHVDEKGEFSPEIVNIVGEEAAASLVGKDVLGEGNAAMLKLLTKEQRVVKTEKINHRYPYDWKTNKPVIVTATSQWFANLCGIKEDALTALRKVSFYPHISRNRLQSFIQSRSEWCISRQRVWGVPIPALHHIQTGKVLLDSKILDHIIHRMETDNLDWWDSPIEDFVPGYLWEKGKTPAESWERGKDTMDVWFDSGTSWSMLSEMGVLGNDRGKPDCIGRQFDADLCLEGSDQHRGWFQSQLLTALGSAPAGQIPVSPYATLMTHGMVLDEKGKKMSKSLGNIISPMTIVNGSNDDKTKVAYGADVLRLWAATVEHWKDMSIGPTVIAQVAESLRKLRNSARFCLANLGPPEALAKMERVPTTEMGYAEKYVMHELYNLEKTALDEYTTYNFPKVINTLNHFANITLSSLYLDITKDVLYADAIDSHQRRAVITVLEQVLSSLTKIVAPVLPYLAEEIHATWKADGKSVFMTPWKPLSKDWNNIEVARDMAHLLLIRDVVLALLEKARGQKQIKSALEAVVDIILPQDLPESQFLTMLRSQESFLKTLFIVSDVTITDEGSLGTDSPEWLHLKTNQIPNSDEDMVIRIRPANLHKCPRCWTYTRPKDNVLCGRCSNVVAELSTQM